MRAREVLVVTLVALAAACAKPEVYETAAAPPVPLDASAPVSPPSPEPLRAEDDELGLAEYERMLADKETRLRAAGVLLAARGELAKEEQRGGTPFAEPPPASRPLAGAAADEDTTTTKPSKSRRADKGDGRGASAAPRPTQPTGKGPTTATTGSEKKKKSVQYDPTPQPKPADANAEYEPPTETEAAAAGGRCQTICDLSSATCELEGKICDLAARHPDDPRYGELCRRADDDCRIAAEACQRCSP